LFLLVPNTENKQNKSTSDGVQSWRHEGPKCFVDANGVLWRWNYGTKQWDSTWDEPEDPQPQPLPEREWLERRRPDVNPALYYKWRSPADEDDDWRTTARKAKESSRSSHKVGKTNCDWGAASKTWRDNEKADRKRKYYRSECGRRRGK
jgi:hypothetical protein